MASRSTQRLSASDQEAVEALEVPWSNVAEQNETIEALFASTQDAIDAMAAAGEAERTAALAKQHNIEKWCLGVAVLSFASVLDAETYIKIDDQTIDDRINPRPINDGHRVDLANVIGVPELKTDYKTPIHVMIDKKLIDKDCLRQMKKRDLYSLEERPPLFKLNNVTEEEHVLRKEVFWKQSLDDKHWLTTEELKTRMSRIRELRDKRPKATTINGTHRSSAMQLVAQSAHSTRESLIQEAREGKAETISWKNRAAKLMRDIANCTYRILVFAHDTPATIVTELARNTQKPPQLGPSNAEHIWIVGQQYHLSIKSFKELNPALPHADIMNLARRDFNARQGYVDELPDLRRTTVQTEGDVHEEEANGSKGKQRGRKRKKSESASHSIGKNEGDTTFEKLGSKGPLLEMVIATRGLWAVWNHMVLPSHGTTMLRDAGSALAVKLWLEMENLICIANVTDFDQLTACESYLKGKKTVTDGYDDAVGMWNSMSVRTSKQPVLLSLWTLELSNEFDGHWSNRFSLTKQQEDKSPLPIWTSETAVRKLRRVFWEFGSSSTLQNGDRWHRLLGARFRLYSLLPTAPPTVIDDGPKPGPPLSDTRPSPGPAFFYPGVAVPFEKRIVQLNRHAVKIPTGESAYLAVGLGPIQARLSLISSILNDPELHRAMKSVEAVLSKQSDRTLDKCMKLCSSNKSGSLSFPIVEALEKRPGWRHGSASTVRKKLQNACKALFEYTQNRPPGSKLEHVLSDHPILTDLISGEFWSSVQYKRWVQGWPTGGSDHRVAICGVGWGFTLDYYQELVLAYIVRHPDFLVLIECAEKICRMRGQKIWFSGLFDTQTLQDKPPEPLTPVEPSEKTAKAAKKDKPSKKSGEDSLPPKLDTLSASTRRNVNALQAPHPNISSSKAGLSNPAVTEVQLNITPAEKRTPRTTKETKDKKGLFESELPAAASDDDLILQMGSTIRDDDIIDVDQLDDSDGPGVDAGVETTNTPSTKIAQVSFASQVFRERYGLTPNNPRAASLLSSDTGKAILLRDLISASMPDIFLFTPECSYLFLQNVDGQTLRLRDSTNFQKNDKLGRYILTECREVMTGTFREINEQQFTLRDSLWLKTHQTLGDSQSAPNVVLHLAGWLRDICVSFVLECAQAISRASGCKIQEAMTEVAMMVNSDELFEHDILRLEQYQDAIGVWLNFKHTFPLVVQGYIEEQGLSHVYVGEVPISAAATESIRLISSNIHNVHASGSTLREKNYRTVLGAQALGHSNNAISGSFVTYSDPIAPPEPEAMTLRDGFDRTIAQETLLTKGKGWRKVKIAYNYRTLQFTHSAFSTGVFGPEHDSDYDTEDESGDHPIPLVGSWDTEGKELRKIRDQTLKDVTSQFDIEISDSIASYRLQLEQGLLRYASKEGVERVPKADGILWAMQDTADRSPRLKTLGHSHFATPFKLSVPRPEGPKLPTARNKDKGKGKEGSTIDRNPSTKPTFSIVLPAPVRAVSSSSTNTRPSRSQSGLNLAAIGGGPTLSQRSDLSRRGMSEPRVPGLEKSYYTQLGMTIIGEERDSMNISPPGSNEETSAPPSLVDPDEPLGDIANETYQEANSPAGAGPSNKTRKRDRRATIGSNSTKSTERGEKPAKKRAYRPPKSPESEISFKFEKKIHEQSEADSDEAGFWSDRRKVNEDQDSDDSFRL
ncbi:hypothetical protein FRC07_007903 [Ceratobasidium sp. 392]|nr:hypothetical protein FRC07_007903 [Ceratobasidium sp. 392]